MVWYRTVARAMVPVWQKRQKTVLKGSNGLRKAQVVSAVLTLSKREDLSFRLQRHGEHFDGGLQHIPEKK